jgi:CyaY protein
MEISGAPLSGIFFIAKSMLSDQQFQSVSESAFTRLQRDLEKAAEKYGFEVDRNQGALTIEFEDPPAKFVVSPNSPVKQIWISARVKSFKLNWDAASTSFVFEDGRNLHTLIADLVSEQIHDSVTL